MRKYPQISIFFLILEQKCVTKKNKPNFKKKMTSIRAFMITTPTKGVYKIVSGGQSGVDRAALDFAIANGVPYGGWIPRDRMAEDGPLDPRRYSKMAETGESDYRKRTAWNVRDSDATVIISGSPVLTGGTALTAELAREMGKPLLIIDPTTLEPGKVLSAFMAKRGTRTLNVAGPRASIDETAGPFVKRVLRDAFVQLGVCR